MRQPFPLLVLLSTLAGACVVEEGKDEGADSAANPVLDADATVLDVTAELGEIVTVVIVRWRTDEPTTGYVEFGADTNYGMRTNSTELATEHEVLLLGNTADLEVHFRVVLTEGDQSDATVDYTITTGSLPTGIPQFTATGTLTDEWAFNVIPTQGAALAVTIVNTRGEIVWYYQPSVQGGNLMRSLLASDRKSVILGHAGTQGDLSAGRVQWISLDGGTVTEAAVPGFDHDLVELPDGTIGMIVVDERTRSDGAPWGADTLVELYADGTTKEIWNAWDAFEDPESLPSANFPNWTHGNGLDYWPDEDAYLLSMKELGTVAKIPRSTGEIEWMINGSQNQFDYGDDEIIQVQHQFEVLENGNLLMFDNGTQQRGYSRAVELDIDEDALTANQVWEYIREPSVFVAAKGDVHRFDNGNTQVVWSSVGEIQMVSPDGTPVWALNAELGQGFTFVQPVSSFYVAD